MIRSALIVLKVALISALLGCSSEKEQSGVFVVINGRAITVDEVKKCVLMKAKMHELSGKPIDNQGFAAWANSMSISVLRTIVSSTLIEQELSAMGMEASKEDYAGVLSACNKSTGRSATSLEELADDFGEFRRPFLDNCRRSAAVSAYERVNWKPNVTDLMVRQHMNFQSNAVQHAAEIDRKARDKANAAYGRLMAGEKWSKVASELSEDKLLNPNFEKYSKDWICTGPDAFGIKALAKKLPLMERGAFTEPIESRDGLMIIRFEGMRGDLYRLSRILFRMARPVDAPKSYEEARESLIKSMVLSKRQKTLDRLWEAAKFEYPMGTNFNFKIWKE